MFLLLWFWKISRYGQNGRPCLMWSLKSFSFSFFFASPPHFMDYFLTLLMVSSSRMDGFPLVHMTSYDLGVSSKGILTVLIGQRCPLFSFCRSTISDILLVWNLFSTDSYKWWAGLQASLIYLWISSFSNIFLQCLSSVHYLRRVG